MFPTILSLTSEGLGRRAAGGSGIIYAPRAVANEPRFACGFVWGANRNWGEVQEVRRRTRGSGRCR